MKLETDRMIKISILGVFSYILLLIEMNVPIFPFFLKIDISDLPALVGTFAFGPIAGIFIQFIKSFLHFLTNSSTGGIGSIANFLIGSSLVIPAGIIYHLNKSRQYAIIGIVVGVLTMTIFAGILNYYVLIPLYSAFIPIEELVELSGRVNPLIKDKFTLILFGITPFNVTKGALTGVLTVIIYKKISPVLK